MLFNSAYLARKSIFSSERFAMKKSSLKQGFLILCTLFLTTPSLYALDFSVINTDDAGTGSLRQAIIDAESNPGMDNILVNVNGTVNLATVLPTITQDLAIVGTGADNFTVNGGSIAGGGRIFTVEDGGATSITLTISGMTLTGGSETNGGAIFLGEEENLSVMQCNLTGNAAVEDGGAIFQSSGGNIDILQSNLSMNTAGDQGGAIRSGSGLDTTVNIIETTFNNNQVIDNNTGSPAGGAIAHSGGPGTINVLDSVFLNNSATEVGATNTPQGGAIAMCCGEPLVLNVQRSTFDGNQLLNDPSDTDPNSEGGAIQTCCSGDLDVQISESTFRNNHSDEDGGAVYGCCGTFTNFSLTRNIFEGNTANGRGGGLFTCCATVTAVIDESTFANNMAGIDPLSDTGRGSGGGYFSCCGPAAVVTNSTFNGNSAETGGGLYQCCSDPDDPIRVTNCTFNENTAANTGGALQLGGALGGGGALELSFLTVDGNTALGVPPPNNTIKFGVATTLGGGIFNGNGDSLELINSIVSNNVPADCGYEQGSMPVTLGNNLDTDDSCALDTNLGDLPATDPLLSSLGLANNGGLTQTIALQVESPAVDHIAPTDCNDVAGNPINRDQRGVPRPLDGNADGGLGCDIGAYELIITDLSLTKTANPITVESGDQVTYQINVVNEGPEAAPNVVVEDTLPAGVTFVSASDSCSQSGLVVICDLGDLANGAQVAIQIIVTINTATAGTEIVNTAVVTFSGEDSNPDNNSDSAVVTVVATGTIDISGSGCSLGTTPPPGAHLFWLGMLLGAIALGPRCIRRKN